uniref:Uncharacterized protein n=1 Tax=Nelumbo nucifera TaxID=4432 RepID=A0A822Z9G1_NELNU|nr:TPA_asm: hypothetical protein HUJ06_001154 [Nelumbo nucifera]
MKLKNPRFYQRGMLEREDDEKEKQRDRRAGTLGFSSKQK